MGAFRNFFATINAWLIGLFQPRRARAAISRGSEDDTRTTLTPEQLMQTAMHQAMQLTETTEDVMEKGVSRTTLMRCAIGL